MQPVQLLRHIDVYAMEAFVAALKLKEKGENSVRKLVRAYDSQRATSAIGRSEPVAAEDVTLQPERSTAPLKRQYTQEQLEQRQAAAERRKVASEKFKAEKGAVARAE
jgi:hypothetical protein